jgi:transcriptional regulator with XRE-family HTH domain
MSTTTAGAFGAKVEEYRERLGMMQKELAKKVGLSPSHLNRIENGTREPPRVGTVRRMIKALRLTEDGANELVELAGLSPLVLQKNSSKKDLKGAVRVKTAGRKDKQNQRIVGHSQALKSGTQTISTPLHSTAHSGTIHSAMTLPDSLLYITFDQIEARIKSRDLSEEQMKRMADGLLDSTDLLLEVIKPQHEGREED